MSVRTVKAGSGSIKPVYVISGETGRLRDAQLAQLREQVLAGCDWTMCRRTFDGSEADIGEVLDELRTLPFLGSRRVVEIHQADRFANDHRQALEEYLASPSTTGVLVFVLDKPLAGNLRLTKAIKKIGQCYSVGGAKRQDIPRALAVLAKDTYGKVLEHDAAQMLQELVGESLNRLAEELEKLSLYVGERPKITVEDVLVLVGQNRELSAFEMIDALVRQDPAKAMQLLERILAQDRSGEYTIIGMLGWYIRRLRKAQVLLAKGLNDGQICNQVRVWYRKSEFMRQVRQMKPESLRLACKQLMEADRAVKTGATRVRNAVERFIWSLTTGNVQARVVG